MAFDPDAYLNEQSAPAFDPDAYLGEKPKSSGPAASWKRPGRLLLGVGEEALGLGSRALAYPLSRAVAVGSFLSPWKRAEEAKGVVEDKGERPADALNDAMWNRAGREKQAVERLLTYEPRTPEGRELLGTAERGLGVVSKPFQWAGQGLAAATDAVNRLQGIDPATREKAREFANELGQVGSGLLVGPVVKGVASGAKLLRKPGAVAAEAAPVEAAAAEPTSIKPAPLEGKIVPSEASELAGLSPADLTAQARYLAGRGVRLTKGLQDPRSLYNHMELGVTSKGGATGQVIREVRAQALGDAIGQVFEEGRPPGFTKPLAGTINDRYAALKGAWDSAYDGIRGKGEKVYPAIHDGQGGQPLLSTANKPGVIDQIVNDAGEIWDDASRAQAKRFLDNQLSRLPETKGALGQVDLGDMLKVLSNVKKAGSSALKQQKYDLAQILDRSQDAIEQAIESQATPETSAALKALNAKYRDFKVVEDAVTRAGDSPQGITPARLAASVKAAEPLRSRYASGSPDWEMRKLSQAISNVFDESISPPTGQRLAAVKLAGLDMLPDKFKNPVLLRDALKGPAGQPAALDTGPGLFRAALSAGVPPAALVAAMQRAQAAGFDLGLPPAAADEGARR